jgi:N6-adenosine-specific RNA methylase IME4
MKEKLGMKKAEPELRLVDLALLDDHPDNPRLYDREEVIAGIAANLNGTYSQKHAVYCRPVGDRFQLTSGHHRKKAALRAGLKQVWAWVQAVTDDDAHVELVLANNQGELGPLGIGLHVLKAVPLGKGGKGRKGGLSEYAERIGKTKQYVAQLRQAAEVAEASKPTTGVVGLIDRTKHLAALHAAPEPLWPVLVESLLQRFGDNLRDWTVELTEETVGTLKRSLDLAGKWQAAFLYPERVARAVVLDQRKSTFFGNLASTADLIANLIEEHAKELPKGTMREFQDWLAANAGGDSWGVKELQAYRLRVEELAGNPLPDGVFNVILADPPWEYDFAETDNRQVENQYPTLTSDDISEMAATLPFADDAVLFLWATAPKLREALAVMEAWGFEYKTNLVWDKQKIGMGYWARGQHELLLVGTRGDFSPPEPATRAASVISEERGEHSAKPEASYRLIEQMFPEAKRLEIFSRREREGWTAWGNESGKGHGRQRVSQLRRVAHPVAQGGADRPRHGRGHGGRDGGGESQQPGRDRTNAKLKGECRSAPLQALQGTPDNPRHGTSPGLLLGPLQDGGLPPPPQAVGSLPFRLL